MTTITYTKKGPHGGPFLWTGGYGYCPLELEVTLACKRYRTGLTNGR